MFTEQRQFVSAILFFKSCPLAAEESLQNMRKILQETQTAHGRDPRQEAIWL